MLLNGVNDKKKTLFKHCINYLYNIFKTLHKKSCKTTIKSVFKTLRIRNGVYTAFSKCFFCNFAKPPLGTFSKCLVNTRKKPFINVFKMLAIVMQNHPCFHSHVYISLATSPTFSLSLSSWFPFFSLGLLPLSILRFPSSPMFFPHCVLVHHLIFGIKLSPEWGLARTKLGFQRGFNKDEVTVSEGV